MMDGLTEEQRTMYDNEPWAEIARMAGLEPYHTESKARCVAGCAADEIARLRAEVGRLREALEDISEPIKKMRQEAERTGARLSGIHALQLSSDAEYLKGIARAALNGEAQ